MNISKPLKRLRTVFGFISSLFLIFYFSTFFVKSTALASSFSSNSLQAEYDITVYIDPAAQTIKGRNVITTESQHELILALNKRFIVTKIIVDGIDIDLLSKNHRMMQTWQIPYSQKTKRRIEVSWQGSLLSLNTSLNHQETLNRNKPVSSEFGTFLPDSSGWYPHIIGKLASYRVSLNMPHGQSGIVAGKIIKESDTNEGYHALFEFPFPSEGIDLMGGPYIVETDSIYGTGGKKIWLRTYFHPQIKELASEYIHAVKKYIHLYESWIGEYPFTEFSIVSSPTPTGFGMPTLTYLGINVLRLPFIRSTSLGHEVLHNWWGNGVYPYYPGGNWSEGLTTFMADYTYKERIGPEAAREMRLSWLRDFVALPSDQDFALENFTTRMHGASKIIGYNKAAMMFLMLRDLLGNESFDRALRLFWNQNQFQIASWSDLKSAFETESGKNLKIFFEQWLKYKGAPFVRIASAVSTKSGSGYHITVILEQAGSSYDLHVPISIHSKKEIEIKTFNLKQERQIFSFNSSVRPTKVTLDPDFRLFRKLAPDEAPPILRQIMLGQFTETVLLTETDEGRAIATELASKLLRRKPEIAVFKETGKSASVLVIGLQNQVSKWLVMKNFPSHPVNIRSDGTAQVWSMRQNGITFVIVSAKDVFSLRALIRPLPHYGRQSYVVFDGAKVIQRGIWPARVQEVIVNN